MGRQRRCPDPLQALQLDRAIEWNDLAIIWSASLLLSRETTPKISPLESVQFHHYGWNQQQETQHK